MATTISPIVRAPSAIGPPTPRLAASMAISNTIPSVRRTVMAAAPGHPRPCVAPVRLRLAELDPQPVDLHQQPVGGHDQGEDDAHGGQQRDHDRERDF
jgi:hypothetical protein